MPRWPRPGGRRRSVRPRPTTGPVARCADPMAPELAEGEVRLTAAVPEHRQHRDDHERLEDEQHPFSEQAPQLGIGAGRRDTAEQGATNQRINYRRQNENGEHDDEVIAKGSQQRHDRRRRNQSCGRNDPDDVDPRHIPADHLTQDDLGQPTEQKGGAQATSRAVDGARPVDRASAAASMRVTLASRLGLGRSERCADCVNPCSEVVAIGHQRGGSPPPRSCGCHGLTARRVPREVGATRRGCLFQRSGRSGEGRRAVGLFELGCDVTQGGKRGSPTSHRRGLSTGQDPAHLPAAVPRSQPHPRRRRDPTDGR